MWNCKQLLHRWEQFMFFLFFNFLLLFNYSCVPFLPSLHPTPAEPPSLPLLHPPPPSPLIWSMCPPL